MAKEKVKFLTTKEMLEYAMEKKPELRHFLEDPEHGNRKPALIAEIKRTLFEHKLVVRQHEEKENGTKKAYERYQVSEPVAKFVVGNMLSGYFDQKIIEYKKIEAEEHQKKYQNSEQMLNNQQQVLHEMFSSFENNEESTAKVLEDSVSRMSEYVSRVEHGGIFKRIQNLLEDILKIIEKIRKSENQEYIKMSRSLENPRNHMARCIRENSGIYGVSIYTELYSHYTALEHAISETDRMFQNTGTADAEIYGAESLPSILLKIKKSMEIMNTASTYKQRIQTMSGMIENYDEYGMNKRIYEHHIKTICGNPEYEGDKAGVPLSYIEDTVCQAMVRALFEKFYDFNEEEFRKDLVRRSMLITPEDPWKYEEGFQELTEKLEHPVGNYIFPKKKPF